MSRYVPAESGGPNTPSRRRRLAIAVTVLLCATLVGLALVQVSFNRADRLATSVTSQGREAETPSAKAAGRDEQLRRRAVGTWEDSYQGKRTMTLRADGSAVMVVELDGLKATLFASRLQFEMVWTVERGRLIKETVSGEPAEKVALILKVMGNRAEEEILQITEDQLLLLDQDGKTTYDWKRLR